MKKNFLWRQVDPHIGEGLGNAHLVLQHAQVEHPGIFRTFRRRTDTRGTLLNWTKAKNTDIDQYDALWVMGGPMDVWQEAEYPWLKAENFIKQSVMDKGKPYLGLCLGHQLLAEALGGEVDLRSDPKLA